MSVDNEKLDNVLNLANDEKYVKFKIPNEWGNLDKIRNFDIYEHEQKEDIYKEINQRYNCQAMNTLIEQENDKYQ